VTRICVLAALVFAASAAATPGEHPFRANVKSVKGKVTAYAFTITAKLPQGMTVTGLAPNVSGTAHLPKGTAVVAAVGANGNGSWKIAVVVDAVGAASSAASTVSGSVNLPGPLASDPATQTGVVRMTCAQLLDFFANKAHDVTTIATWVLLGPTKMGKKIVVDSEKSCV
jgi:hypothetical protein